METTVVIHEWHFSCDGSCGLMPLKFGLGKREGDCLLPHSIYIQLLKVRAFLQGLASLTGVQNTIPIKIPLEARKPYSYPVSQCGFFH